MQPDHLDLEGGCVGQDKQLHHREDKDDPYHDLVAEQLDEFFIQDEYQGPHIRQAGF
jgi:hypothetical protein